MLSIFKSLVDYGALEEQIIHLSLDIAVKKLSAATRQSTIPGFTIASNDGVLVGEISAKEVRLSRARPLRTNIFKPFFYGRFVEKNDQVILSGYFTMHPVTKFVIAVYFFIAVFISLILFFVWLGQPKEAMPVGYQFYGPGILLVFTLFVLFVRHVSNGDRLWVQTQINKNLLSSD